MKVNYLCLKNKFEGFEKHKIFEDIFTNCNFIMGKEVDEFEKHFADYCGVKYAIGLNSATDALFLALKAIGTQNGDEVITAPNSFIATAGAIVAAGASPVFVDVCDDYNINPDLIEKAITPKTKAIMPVHLTGNPADMENILAIANKHNIAIIEDAAQAVGASINNKKVGSFGIGCFSLHPLKNLNVCGDGGVLTTNDDDIYEKILPSRNHGLISRDESLFFGFNSRLDTIQASIALLGLNEIESVNNKRIENANLYDNKLSTLQDFIKVPKRKTNANQVFHTYVISVKNRNKLIEFLSKNGVETKIHYPIPIHLQKAAQYLGYKKGDFPKAETQANDIISLPIHQYLTHSEINYVCETIYNFYKNNGE